MEIHPSVQQDIGPLFGPLLKDRYRLFKFYLDVLLHNCRQFSKLLEQELAIIRCADNAQNCWNDLSQKEKFKSIKRVFIILIMETIKHFYLDDKVFTPVRIPVAREERI